MPNSRVFAVAPDWTMPALGRRVVSTGGKVSVTSKRSSRAAYDTAAGDLASVGATLGRTGDVWELTAFGETSRVEAAGRGLPAGLRELLFGLRAGGAVRLAAREDREETVHVVSDADGTHLGQLADVYVRTSRAGTAATVTEQRVVEVAGWSGPFLAAVERVLLRSGAQAVSVADAIVEAPTAAVTVGDEVRRALGEQRAEILEGDLALRRGEPAVHSTRVGIRRLRSILRVVPVTEPDATRALDDELRWYAAQLGELRDREVLHDHLHATVSAARNEPSLAAALALIDHVLNEERAAAQTSLERAMSGRRYAELLRALRSWADDPPLTGAAEHPAERLGKHVRKAIQRLEKRLLNAGDDPEALHRARKAAKRVRYVAALASGTRGAARRAKVVQRRLGDHQDSVVAADFLARLARTATGDAAFGCGVLWERERRRARKARRVTR